MRVHDMHPFYYVGSLRVSVFYLQVYFLAYIYQVYVFPFFVVFVSMLSLELCRCPSDILLSSIPRTGTGLATAFIAGYD